ncbi:MAG: hypothetical protein II660_09045, partial [Bacteroidales bacterium]|nr:hypothetical protein [Bacteroidales bacterium]
IANISNTVSEVVEANGTIMDSITNLSATTEEVSASTENLAELSNKNVEKYTDSTTPEYKRMVDDIASQLNLDSLKFNTIETLVKSIGLPREDLCLHCFDGSSAFTLEEENK